jgi:hypothetical protein
MNWRTLFIHAAIVCFLSCAVFLPALSEGEAVMNWRTLLIHAAVACLLLCAVLPPPLSGGAPDKGAAASPGEPGLVNVRHFGAVGDGEVDDTAAIQAALGALPDAGGVVYFPPGRYRTATIKARNHVTLKGDSAWGYRRESGASVLSPVRDDLECLLDLRGCIGTRLVGLTLAGRRGRGEMHGVLSKHPGTEQNIVIEDCRITGFSGSGIRLDNCWVFAVRHSLINGNGLSGIDGSGSYDGWLIDNQVTGNGRGGVFGQRFSSVTITANRIEWNRLGGIVVEQGGSLQIANCFFDRNYGPGVSLERAATSAVSGSIFRRNGFHQSGSPDLDCHLRLTNSRGVTVTGNTMLAGIFPPGTEEHPASPGTGLLIERLTGCVIAQNALHHGAMSRLVLDRGSHADTVIEANPGSLQAPGGSY